MENAFPTAIVRYKELLAAPERHARMLLEFAGLPGSKSAIEQAARVHREPELGPGNGTGAGLERNPIESIHSPLIPA